MRITQILPHKATFFAQQLWTILFGKQDNYSQKLLEILAHHGVAYNNLHKIDRPFLSVYSYKTRVVHDALWQYKFKNNHRLSHVFAQVLYDSLADYVYEYERMHAKRLILCPLPSDAKRKRTRGYCHTTLVCDQLSKQCGDSIEYIPDLLIKIKHTKAQSRHRSRSARLSSQQDAYRINDKHVVRITDHTVLLFDDVYTTGATLQSATKALLSGNPKQVQWITIAH